MHSNWLFDFKHTWLGGLSATVCTLPAGGTGQPSLQKLGTFLRDKWKWCMLIISFQGLNWSFLPCMHVEWVKWSWYLSSRYQKPKESSLTGFMLTFWPLCWTPQYTLLTDSQIHLEILKGNYSPSSSMGKCYSPPVFLIWEVMLKTLWILNISHTNMMDDGRFFVTEVPF